MNNILTKNFTATAAIAPYSIVCIDANGDAATAAAATDALIGVADSLGADAAGGRCDVMMAGIAEVKLGANVTAGDPLTANANGHAIPAAPATGANVRTIGVALQGGIAESIVPVLLAPGSVQG